MDPSHEFYIFFLITKGYPVYTNRVEVIDGLLSANSWSMG